MQPLDDERAGGQPALHIVVLATFAAEPIAEALELWIERAQIAATVRFAPYNQVVEQLADPAGMAARNAGGVQLLLLRLEDWAGDDRAPAQLEQAAPSFVRALGARAAATPATYLVGICPSSPGAFGEAALGQALDRQRQAIEAGLAPIDGTMVLDLATAIVRYQVEEWYDPLTDELGHMPYTYEFFAALGTAVAQEIFAARGVPHAIEAQTADEVLAAIRARGRAEQRAAESYVAPRNALERGLAELLAQTLGLDRVGVHDNFFELGGDSTLALTLISRIHTLFQIETPLMTAFFEMPTVAGIAEIIVGDVGDADQAARMLPDLLRVADEA